MTLAKASESMSHQEQGVMHAPIQSRGQHIVRGPSLGGADADKVSPAGQESFPSRFLPRAGRGRPGSPDTRGVCGLEGPALPALFRALGGVGSQPTLSAVQLAWGCAGKGSSSHVG